MLACAFQRLESRVNRVGLQRTSNAIALLDGVPVPGTFDRDVEVAQAGEMGITGVASTFTLATSSLAGVDPEGKPLSIDGRSDLPTYRVDEARPDGTGITVLILKRTD